MAIDYTKRPSTPAASGQAPAGGVNLSKVTLTKTAPAVSLSKKGGGGMLRVNLKWNARPTTAAPTGGFLKRLTGGGNTGIDLDLGCLFEYTDGSKGVVQALGNALRDRHTLGTEPIIWLDGDDRSGSADGENLFVNLDKAASIRRVLVFAFIYDGTPNWAQADAVVTLFPSSGPQVEMRLDEHDPNSRMCAIALLENRNGEVVVNREIKYIKGAQDALDRAYGWGMNWSAGRK
jgi:tellurite resistance protein TerA